MPKDFREQSKNYEGGKSQKTGGASYEDLPPEGKEEFDRIKQSAEKYGGKSESELMSELMKKVAQGKKDGSFSAAEIERLTGELAPMLTSSQRKRLNELIRMIK